MILFPPAKINLGLNVLYKREDGYHEMESCMVEVPITDVLELIPAEEFTFSSSGLVINGNSDDNLCVKAFRLMQERYGVGNVYMHLQKNIPMGAGLGGGSADATYVLMGLNQLFDLNLEDKKLEELAAELGSDCAFFVKGGTQMSTGRGEVLAPHSLSLKGLYLKLINPGIHIGTAEAYNHVEKHPDYSVEEIIGLPMTEWPSQLLNGFENYAIKTYPEIGEIKEAMYAEGALFAAMSGSGSSVFGLYEEKPDMSSNHSEWIYKL